MLAYVLTFGRIVLAGAFAACLAWLGAPGELTAAGASALLAIAIAEELSDVFDGIAARRAGSVTALGAILDPLADSLARLTIYFAMALAGWVALAVPFVMAARDIVVAYTRIACAATGLATSARLSGKIKALVLIAVTAWSLADYLRAAWPAIKKMRRL